MDQEILFTKDIYDASHNYVHRHRHHRSHRDGHHEIAQGAIVGAGAAEMVHHCHKKQGEGVSHGFGHLSRTVGAGALGAVAFNEVSRHLHDR